MNANIHAEDLGSTLIEVDSTPLALRLPAGAALFALRGEIWLTQEGRLDDVFLAHGARYDVDSRRPIVVSATRGPAELYVARPADARAVVAADLFDFVRSNAARLRREEIDHLISTAGRHVSALGARVMARLRAPAAGRSPHDATA